MKTRQLLLLGCAVLLLTGSPGHAQDSATCESARAQTTCLDWNNENFHRVATVDTIRECLASGQVDVNQPPDGRSLLTRLVIATKSSKKFRRTHRRRASCPETPGHILASVEFLLAEKDRYGLNLDAKDDSGRTALHYALGDGTAWPLAVRLLDAGADPLAVSEERRAWAFRQDYWEEFFGVADMLLDRVEKIEDLKGKAEELKACRTVECLVDGLLSE